MTGRVLASPALSVALVGGLALMATGPVAADHACARDPWPSFRMVAPTAERIVVGTVGESLSRPGALGPTGWFWLAVEEVPRGYAPASLEVLSLGSGMPLLSTSDPYCAGPATLVARPGSRIAIAHRGRVPGVRKRVTSVAIIDGRRGPNRGMERLTLRQVRRLAGHAPDGSTLPPRPETTDELLARLATEEVEPGVLRVLGDGFRELSPPEDGGVVPGTYAVLMLEYASRRIAAGHDGSVWLFGPEGFFRIGDEATHRWGRQPRWRGSADLEVLPNGSLWRVAPGIRMSTFDGEAWERRWRGRVPSAIESKADGSLWATWARCGADPESCVTSTLGRREGGRWTITDVPRVHPNSGMQLAVTVNGHAWVCCRGRPWAEPPRLLRLDGDGWRVEELPPLDAAGPTGPDEVGAPLLFDASGRVLWVRRSARGLARRDRTGWEVFRVPAQVPGVGSTMGEDGLLVASPDRSVWVTASVDPATEDADLKCDGVVRFDGTTFSHYLEGTCVYAMDAAADGSLWLQAGRADIHRSPPDSSGAFHLAQPAEPIGTYVIRPPHRPPADRYRSRPRGGRSSTMSRSACGPCFPNHLSGSLLAVRVPTGSAARAWERIPARS